MSTNNSNQDLMTALESLRKLIDKDNILGETIDTAAIPTLEPVETAANNSQPQNTAPSPSIDQNSDADQLSLPELVEFEAELAQQHNDERFEQFWQLLAPKLKVVCKECFDELEKNSSIPAPKNRN